MRRLTLCILAALCGATVALVNGRDDRDGLIASSRASDIKNTLETVAVATREGNCQDAQTAAKEANDRITELPGTVDRKLRRRLRSGARSLVQQSQTECEQNQADTGQTNDTSPEPTPNDSPQSLPDSGTDSPPNSTDNQGTKQPDDNQPGSNQGSPESNQPSDNNQQSDQPNNKTPDPDTGGTSPSDNNPPNSQPSPGDSDDTGGTLAPQTSQP